jgi:hypothetical protein
MIITLRTVRLNSEASPTDLLVNAKDNTLLQLDFTSAYQWDNIVPMFLCRCKVADYSARGTKLNTRQGST